MKKVISALLLGISCMACSLFEQPVTWEFIQSVGGIALDTPVRAGTFWSLPIQLDISGLTKVTVEPNTLNSGLACQRVSAVVDGQVIYLTIFVASAGSERTAKCGHAVIGSAVAGRYKVFYKGNDEDLKLIGEVEFASKQKL
ncbi:hypothetical protein [Undibacterium flavidum]|uniref:Lipoprotein n=1 Tax=Undibacterium flavidum TaxID=2762297 RepID=A0ABR6Y620_9BURK|nr:hypothetical protein [Undibacterium flavidum]MBC3872067.1 hypothetical protein [Undibacterium flavidum]